MKSYSILLTIAFFFWMPFSLFSQSDNKIKVKWGESFDKQSNKILADIIGFDDTGIYTLRKRSTSVMLDVYDSYLEKLDNNLNPVAEQRLSKVLANRKEDLQDILWHQNKIWLLTSDKVQGKGNFLVKLREVNKNSLGLDGNVKEVVNLNYDWRLSTPIFDYEISRDSSKLMIIYSLPSKRNEADRFGFTIIDEDLEILFRKEIVLPVKDRLFDLSSYEVSNNGDVLLNGVQFETEIKEPKRFGKPNYFYRVFMVPADKDTIFSYKITQEDKYITDLKTSFNNVGDVIGAGFYSDEGTTSIAGSYFFSLNQKTDKIENFNFKKFDLEFILEETDKRDAKTLKKRAEKGKTVELYEYDLDKIILRDDGGALLLAEQYFVSSYNNTYDGFNRNRTLDGGRSYNYNYNNIILVNINPDGSIEWNSKIPKRQNTFDDRGIHSSYTSAIVKDKIYLIYNDNPKNLFHENDKNDRYYSMIVNRDMITTLAVVDKSGKVKKAKLFSAHEADIYLRPKICPQIASNELLLYGVKNRMNRFGRIIFP